VKELREIGVVQQNGFGLNKNGNRVHYWHAGEIDYLF
jgi:hypothetical protein